MRFVIATGKITKRTLDALQAGAVTGFLWDDELKGFGAKITAGGSASYVVQYRMGGREAKTRRYTIGGHGSPWTPFTAREEATRLLRLVAQGIDPVESDKQRRREAVELAFSNYADRFAADCKGKGWSTLVTRSLHLHVKPVLRDKALPTITRIDVVAVFDRMPAEQAANRRNVFAVLIRAIVLTANGKHFSSGHDIGTPGRDADLPAKVRRSLLGDHSALDGAAWAYVREQELYLGLCRRWRAIPKPTIAAVYGACIAGGLMLAWVCDLIIASRDAFFSDPVLRMGIPGVEYFAHAFEMHPRVAREFLFLGERLSAERAYMLGMVNRVVERDELETEAMTIAERLATLPPFGLTLAKQAFNQAEDAMGKRATMDAAFGLHHLAHAHAQMTTGSAISGQSAHSMAGKPRDADGEDTPST